MFNFPQRVYYEHTDHGGVVYHANYLKFMERARTEWLRELGFWQSRLAEQEQLLFAVSNMHLHFLRPARFDDWLDVSVEAVRPGGARLRLRQQISCADVLMCWADVEVACLDADTMKPRRIPGSIRTELSKHAD